MQLLMTVDNPKPQNGLCLNAAKLLLNLLNTEYHALMRLIDAEFPKVILQSAKLLRSLNELRCQTQYQNRRTAQDMDRHGTSIGDNIQKPIQDSFRKGRPGLWGVGLRKSGHTEILLCTLQMESFSKQQA